MKKSKFSKFKSLFTKSKKVPNQLTKSQHTEIKTKNRIGVLQPKSMKELHKPQS